MSREKTTPTVPPEERKKLLKAIIGGEYPEEGVAIVGENRGQLFVRIPRNVSNRLELQKGDKVLFRVRKNEHKKQECNIEKVTA